MTEGGSLPAYANETALLSLQGSMHILTGPSRRPCTSALTQRLLLKVIVKRGGQDKVKCV